ncbi:hypothetical protein ABPG75_000808 [Micractinium tetrahymenae]
MAGPRPSRRCGASAALAAACALLLCLGLAPPASAALTLPWGAILEDLPGWNAVQGGPDWPSNVSISLVDAEVQVEGPPGSRSPLLLATVKLFRNGGTGETSSAGPTIRVKPGEAFQVVYRNALMPAKGTHEELEGEQAFGKLRLPQTTNLHLHGLFSDPGVRGQPSHHDAEHGVKYAGGDNVFLRLESGQQETYTYQVPHDHMPGLFWFRPHFMGSSALGTATAKSALIVEGNEAELLAPPGCKQVLDVLRTAQGPDNYPSISEESIPANPTCCDNNTAGKPFLSDGEALLTLNGGHAPVITMRSGEWQRWQLLYAAYMRYLDLTLGPPSASDSQPPAAAKCELALLGKDGVWLMQMPRSVPHILLATAGRADMLVRCTGPPGAEAVLSSGAGPLSKPPHLCTTPSCTVLDQPVVATMRIESGEGQPAARQDLQFESCSPLRGGYAADLRDDALAAAGATNKVVHNIVTFTPVNASVPSEDCLVNGKIFSIPDPDPLAAPLGSVVEWSFAFAGLHPHHLHTQPVQLVALPILAPGMEASAGGMAGGAGMPGAGAGAGAGMAGGGGGGGPGGRRGLRQGMMPGGSTAMMPGGAGAGMMPGGGPGPAKMAGMHSASPENLAAWAALTPWFQVGDWHDTVLLPAASALGGGGALIRFQPGPWSGYSVIHCHFLVHEDSGCMKMVKWQCPGHSGNEQPEICTSYTAPVAGSY